MVPAASMRAHIIPAVFEDGVLKPEKELPLKDCEHVQIAVLPKAACESGTLHPGYSSVSP